MRSGNALSGKVPASLIEHCSAVKTQANGKDGLHTIYPGSYRTTASSITGKETELFDRTQRRSSRLNKNNLRIL